MREVTYILGIKIYKNRSKMLLKLSQSIYIDKMLKQFSIKEFKRWYLYISYRICLSKDTCLKILIKRDWKENILYTMNIKSIIYVMLYVTPDVSYALSITSRYQSNPSKSYWKIVKNILKYPRRIKNVFLVYEKDELVVHDYLYAGFQ
jgi:hypothetical protein